jgi:dihydrofolate reductase
LIATTRELVAVVPTISTRRGTIHELILQAKDMAGDGDVYLDGGTLIQQALVAGLVDEMCLSIVPTVLGEGVRLFENTGAKSDWAWISVERIAGGMLQVTLRKT